MTTSCLHCQSAFEITPSDLAFYEKVSPVFNGKKELIPPPVLCPDCRLIQRLTFRNERNLYRRHCSRCRKMMVCMYPSDAPFEVYCRDCWWSDQFDPLASGRPFDFTKSFSEQMTALVRATPLPHLVIGDCENSDFTNYAWQNRNTYLLTSSDYSEDCYYGSYVIRSKNCVDCTFISESELCYECIDSRACYQSIHLRDCQNCSDSAYLEHCHGCRSCIGCSGLRNVENYLLNKKATSAEIATARKYLWTGDVERMFSKLHASVPQPYACLEQCEQSTGDHLRSCQNVRHCFDLVEAEDCSYTTLGLRPRSCMDATGVPGSELCNQVAACPEDYALLYSAVIWPKSSYLLYSLFCRASAHCFGCVALHKNSYCILNRQYSKEEYTSLLPKIIAHMRTTGEWGEFFNSSVTPFAYNETIAQEFFPSDSKHSSEMGWQWRDEEEASDQYMGPPVSIPASIDEVEDRIIQSILLCSVTGKPYKVIPQELAFYRKLHIPIPRKCPDQRHRERMALRNPRKLWSRKCAKCGKGIETTYAPERPEIVYCESCYLSFIY